MTTQAVTVNSAALEAVDQEAEALLNTVCCNDALNHYLTCTKAVIFLKSTKVAFGVGYRTAQGFVIARLGSVAANTCGGVNKSCWSAPLFVKVRAAQIGVGIGYAKEYNWILAISNKILNELRSGGHTILGVDSTMTFGKNSCDHKSDLIDLSHGQHDLVNVSISNGLMLDFSFSGGSLFVDDARIKNVYGHVTADAILEGTFPPPAELSRLYKKLNEMARGGLHDRPSLTAASLQRFSLGVDVEQRMVTETGAVVVERVEE